MPAILVTASFPRAGKFFPRKKWLHFQKVPVSMFIIPLLLFERPRQTEQKIWLTEMEKTSRLTWCLSCEFEQLLQLDKELLQPLASLVVVAPSWVISGTCHTGFLTLPSTWGRYIINFPLAVTRGGSIHSLRDINADLPVQLFRKQSMTMLMKCKRRLSGTTWKLVLTYSSSKLKTCFLQFISDL